MFKDVRSMNHVSQNATIFDFTLPTRSLRASHTWMLSLITCNDFILLAMAGSITRIHSRRASSPQQVYHRYMCARYNSLSSLHTAWLAELFFKFTNLTHSFLSSIDAPDTDLLCSCVPANMWVVCWVQWLAQVLSPLLSLLLSLVFFPPSPSNHLTLALSLPSPPSLSPLSLRREAGDSGHLNVQSYQKGR